MNKILATLAAFAMIMAIYVPIISAQPFVTSATVAGSNGGVPVIENIFVLDDNGDPIPPHGTFGTEIMPNPGVGAQETLYPFWKYVVVKGAGPNDAATISIVEEWLSKADGTDTPLVTTTEVTDYSEVMAIITDAYNQNVITLAEFTQIQFQLDPNKKVARMFKVRNTVSNHDTPGIWTVHFKAKTSAGATGFGSETFCVMELKAFETDFEAIEYGNVQNNKETYVAGDDIWNALGPDGLMRNTIKNQGNVPMNLDVVASPMAEQYPQAGAPIQYIQPSALSVELLGVHLYDLTSVRTLANPLQVCTPTQISFDILTPDGTSAGSYQGTIYLTIGPTIAG